MAFYRFELKHIGRALGKSGQSVISAAAYRSGQKLKRTATNAAAYRAGDTLGEADYSRKRHVLHTEILAPTHAPGWVYDRETLWNEVERRENRKNSRFAYEFLVHLQRELSPAQNLALLYDFIGSEITARGLVADLSIHDTRARDGKSNLHAHILITTRPVSATGWEKHKDRSWNTPAELKTLRQSWAEHINRVLDVAGVTDRVTPESLKNRGIDRLPEPKIGPSAFAIERSGHTTHTGETWRRVRFENDVTQYLPQEMPSQAWHALHSRLHELHRQNRLYKGA